MINSKHSSGPPGTKHLRVKTDMYQVLMNRCKTTRDERVEAVYVVDKGKIRPRPDTRKDFPNEVGPELRADE